MLKAELIGNGFIGGAHRESYERLEKEGADVKLVAICDIREEKLTEYYGQNLYTSVDEMLEKEKLDIVSVCVPTYLHKEISIKCMKAGINVLCEKPMALEYDDCLEMIKVSEETGSRIMVAHVSRFGKHVAIIKEYIESGKFGKPVTAFFTAADGQPTWGYNDWFKDDKLSGGCMLDLQAHNIDLMNWFFGLPEYTSVTAKKCKEEFNGFGTVLANMVYSDGLIVNSWCDWGVPNNKHTKRLIQVNFEKGYVYSSRVGVPEIVAVDYETGDVTDLNDLHTEIEPAGYYNEIKYYVNCIANNLPFDQCPPEESAKVLKVMRSQERSAKNNGAPDQVV